jgi:hypothetical protein
VIIFGSVRFLSKKSNQTEIKKKTNRNRFKPIWLVFLEQKPVQTGLARFFQFGSVFLVWVWFGFFGFMLVKPNRSGFSKF